MSYVDDYDDRLTDFIIFGAKTCTACAESKPANTEYFARDAREDDGLSHSCRTCRAGRDHVRWQTMTPEAKKRRIRQMSRLKSRKRKPAP